jgi:hypothetical protein
MAFIAFAESKADFVNSLQISEELIVVAPAATLRDGSALRLLTASSALAAQALGSAGPAAAMAADASADISGSSISSYISTTGRLARLTFVPLLDSASRHYSPTQSMAISGGLASAGIGGSDTTVLVVLRSECEDFSGHIAVREQPFAIGPAASAIGRACPVYSRKSAASAPNAVVVGFVSADAPDELLLGVPSAVVAPEIFEAVRLTARLAETLALDVKVILLDTTLYIALVVLYTKYAEGRQNDFNVYA